MYEQYVKVCSGEANGSSQSADIVNVNKIPAHLYCLVFFNQLKRVAVAIESITNRLEECIKKKI